MNEKLLWGVTNQVRIFVSTLIREMVCDFPYNFYLLKRIIRILKSPCLDTTIEGLTVADINLGCGANAAKLIVNVWEKS